MNQIINITLIILLIGLIICSSALLGLYLDWSYYNDTETAKLTFRQFKTIYNVIPDDFIFRSNYVRFKYNIIICFKSFF